jgi:RNA polymerase sigma factor (sigma-70 family)
MRAESPNLDMRHLSVGDLVRAAGAGDFDAWNELVNRFAGMVWTVARRHRLSSADAADVSQTTWLRLVEHLNRIEHPERVGGWLATTARRESLRVLRLADRQVPASDDDVFIDLTSDESESPEEIVTLQERDRELWQLFSQLPPRCQLMLQLLGGDEPLSYAELGAMLDMPVGSIGPTRARCLDHLRRWAATRGISVD